MVESPEQRYQRDWTFIQDDRKIRGLDQQPAERWSRLYVGDDGSAVDVRVPSGLRATNLSNVGFKGNTDDLIVLNVNDTPPAGAVWDGPALRVNSDNFVFDGYILNGCLDIYGENPTVRNCIINATSDSFWGIHGRAGTLTVEDTTIIGPGQNPAGVQTEVGPAILTRCDISGFNDGIATLGAAQIKQCYVHHLAYGPDKHNDGIQYYGGSDLVVQDCYFDLIDYSDGRPAGLGQNACVTLNETAVPNIDPIIDNNFMVGGAYYLRIAGDVSGAVVTDNDFGPLTSPAFNEINVIPAAVATWNNNRRSDGSLIPQPTE